MQGGTAVSPLLHEGSIRAPEFRGIHSGPRGSRPKEGRAMSRQVRTPTRQEATPAAINRRALLVGSGAVAVAATMPSAAFVGVSAAAAAGAPIGTFRDPWAPEALARDIAEHQGTDASGGGGATAKAEAGKVHSRSRENMGIATTR